MTMGRLNNVRSSFDAAKAAGGETRAPHENYSAEALQKAGGGAL